MEKMENNNSDALLSESVAYQSEDLATDASHGGFFGNCKQLTMKEWMAGALRSSLGDTENNGNKAALCSTPYITCALKIAHSLADQITRQAEQSNEDDEGFMFVAHSSWSDSVAIFVKAKAKKCLDGYSNDNNVLSEETLGNIEEKKEDSSKKETDDGLFIKSTASTLEPDDAFQHPKEDKVNNAKADLEVMMGHSEDLWDDDELPINESIFDDNFFESEIREIGGLREQEDHHPIEAKNYHQEELCSEKDYDYLNVVSAKLRTEESHSGHNKQGNDEMMNIYSLGLVLIELFSSGKRQTQQPYGESLNDSSDGVLHTSALGSIFNPLNLASAMNIIDSLGDDDELFGNGGKCAKNGATCTTASGQAKKHRSSALTTATSVSVEELRLLGIPSSLCDLIDNMIKCSGGDLSDDETYNTMKDVRSDLQSMIECPDIYLEDLDLDKACASGLQQMDDYDNSDLFGRDAELASLQKVYHRSISNDGCECAIVSGPGGIGKSKLKSKLIQYAMSSSDEEGKTGCVYLSGKFDKLQQSQPFYAVTSAFNRYCDWLSTSKNVIIAKKVSTMLKEKLGHETYSLAKSIPSLVKIIGEVEPTDNGNGGGVFDDAQKRLRYLLCQFLEIICDSHQIPLVLSLDDLQWVDRASLAWINQVLLVYGTSRRRLLFLGCCRDDEVNTDEKDDPILRMLQNASDFDISTTKIELGCLDRESVNLFLSHKLKLLPRLTLPLADIIFHKTNGSPLFLEQLVIELCKEGLLRPSLSRRRYVWDLDSILERELPRDVISFITQSISRLPRDILSPLEILSCFGASSDISLVENLEREIGSPLLGSLNTAIAEGFLIRKKNRYHFVHDRVHEAVFNMMPEEERFLKHHEYGLLLSSVAARNNDDGLFLVAVGQLNLGGREAISDKGQGLQAARLNLSAGKISMISMADYFSAYWFFDHGISYLPKDCWDIDYTMTLELYDLSSECAFSNGEFMSLEILSSFIMKHASCYDHKLNAIFLTMRKLLQRGELTDAIELGLDSLRKLGVVFPERITPEFIIQRLESVKEKLGDMSDDDLIHYRSMCSNPRGGNPVDFEEHRIIMKTKILGKLSEAMFHVRPYDQPVPVLEMLELSLEHGFNPQSPLAFALYGGFLVSMGDINTGYRFAKISRTLLTKIGSNQIRGEVICYTAQVMAHVEPIQSVAELHSQGYKEAIAGGNRPFADANSLFRVLLYFFGGEKLGRTKTVLEESMQVIKGHIMFRAYLMQRSRVISALQGTSMEALSDEDCTDFEIKIRKKDPQQSKTYYFNKMFSAFMFRQYDRTKTFAVGYSNFHIKTWVAFFHEVVNKFYFGLVSYWIGREDHKKGRAEWIARGNESKQALQQLATSCSWNVQNKFYLLCAEEKFCERDFEQAEKFYELAISSAKEHRFVNEEALANELAGVFYVETGRRKLSMPYFSRAVEKYQEWEAYGKANALQTYLTEVVELTE